MSGTNDRTLPEETLQDRELSAVSGGAGGQSFAQLAERFAKLNRCADCPSRQFKLYRELCSEEYYRLLMDWSGGGAVDMRCRRRS